MITTKLYTVQLKTLKQYFNTYCIAFYGKEYPLTDTNLINYFRDCLDYYYVNKDVVFIKDHEFLITEEEIKITLCTNEFGQKKIISMIQNKVLRPVKMLSRYNKYLELIIEKRNDKKIN